MDGFMRSIWILFTLLTLLLLSSCESSDVESVGGIIVPPDPLIDNSFLSVEIASDRLTGIAPQVIQFSAQVDSHSNQNIASYEWNFGDGNVVSGSESIEHVYIGAGQYLVELSVIDIEGNTATDSQLVSVTTADRNFLISGSAHLFSQIRNDQDIVGSDATDVVNDSDAEAHSLPSRFVVAGHLDFTNDPSDYYSVTLQANDTVYLNIGTADLTNNDLELTVYRTDNSFVDSSLSDSASESITVPSAGDYFIRVYSSAGSSNYQLTNIENTAISQQTPASSLRLNDHFFSHQAVVLRQTDASLDRSISSTASGDGMLLEKVDLSTPNTYDRTPASADFVGKFDDEILDKMDTLYKVKDLAKADDVVHAEPHYLRKHTITEPNDQYYGTRQWNLRNISLPDAWDITTGHDLITVAVVDSGVLMEHPDLIGRFRDGYDFIVDTDVSLDGDGLDDDPSDPGDRSTPLDEEGITYQSTFHGTYVAGIIGALTNNTEGTAGVAWNISIMPLRVLGLNGYGSSFDVLQAIRYAAGLSNDSRRVPSKKADIINLSLGGFTFSRLENETIQAAIDQGVIIVAAAGNQSTQRPFFPAAYDNVISVGAVDDANELTPYSNYGSSIDVVAPGGRLVGSQSPGAIVSTWGNDSDQSTPIEYGYSLTEGTSMAAPHVSGVIALMKSVYDDLTVNDIETLLSSGSIVDDLGSEGKDIIFGYGLINANKAVTAAMNLSDSPTTNLIADIENIDFGWFKDDQLFLLEKEGDAYLSVEPDMITANVDWVTVDAVSTTIEGLGVYQVSVDRTNLSTGEHSAIITILSSENTLRINVSLEVNGDVTSANAGVTYAVLTNPDDEVLYVSSTTISSGEYPFNFTDVVAGQYYLYVGTDMNNNGSICDSGEICGAWPFSSEKELLNINQNHTEVIFPLDYASNSDNESTRNL